MSLGEVIGAVALWKFLTGGGSSSGGGPAPSDAAPSRDQAAKKPPDAIDFGGAAAAGASLGAAVLELATPASTATAAAAGGAQAAAAAAAGGLQGLQTTGEAAISGAVQGAAGAAKGATTGLAAGLVAAAQALIVAAVAAVVLTALALATNAVIGIYLVAMNRQARAQKGAAYFVRKALVDTETRWQLSLLKAQGAVPPNDVTMGARTNEGGGTTAIDTSVDGVVGAPEEVKAVSPVVPTPMQQVIVSFARFLSVLEVLAHNQVVRDFYNGSVPTNLPGYEAAGDAANEATIASITGPRWAAPSSWGVLPAYDGVQSFTWFNNTTSAAIARFLGRFSGLSYCRQQFNLPNDVITSCSAYSTIQAQQGCLTDSWIARCGLNYLRQVGTFPERWYVDDAAGLAMQFWNLQWRYKSKKVADLRAAGHYVPHELEVTYNLEEAGQMPKPSPNAEIARQSTYDAIPFQLRQVP